MIIDFHTHVFHPKLKADRRRYLSDAVFGVLYASERARLATVEDLIGAMDRDGIDKSVAVNVSWGRQSLCVETNDYLMECAARFPARIVAFGTVNLAEGDSALREIERCSRGGLAGIGEMRLNRDWFDETNEARQREFVMTLKSLGMALLVHASEPVGHEYPGKGDTTPEILYRLICRFPDLRLVCAHWGGGLPFYGLMPEVKKALEGVMFDTAASPYLYEAQIYREVIRILGAERILFGSDFPLLPASRLLKQIKGLGLAPDQEEAILSGNAVRLLGSLGHGERG
jgi:uncharacterized protein